ncbi:unnamed protein product [Hydatigera taeniaeformis]|uniref:Uncharacterized protein n=1 Tax=Hydatigena taeniaeformis TaxID=6205 RepID=A0A0R3WK22_HYDTA|nr:unnamed protein product [Hydatigera taeniaeformis]
MRSSHFLSLSPSPTPSLSSPQPPIRFLSAHAHTTTVPPIHQSLRHIYALLSYKALMHHPLPTSTSPRRGHTTFGSSPPLANANSSLRLTGQLNDTNATDATKSTCKHED